MEQGQDSQGHYWIPQHAHGIHHGNSQVQMDYQGDLGEPAVENLLDRSGLLDELVCQILDEGPSNKGPEVSALNGHENQPPGEAIQDNFQALHVTSVADNAPAWAKSNEMIHENTGHLKLPPGITERPTHPASFDMMYPGIQRSSSQGGIGSSTVLDEQPMGVGKQSATSTKDVLGYVQPSQFMRGDHLEVPYFTRRPAPDNLPSSGGDYGGMPITGSQYNSSQTPGGLYQRSCALLPQSRRSSPVAEDPHQYFRQRASATAQQAQSREQFPRQTRPAPPFPLSEQQQPVNAPLVPNMNLKTQTMQRNVANSWPDFNKFMTKGNSNLRTNSTTFDQNQFQGNAKPRNAIYGQNRPLNYQFSLQRMPLPQGPIQVANQNLGMNGQFQNGQFSARSELYNLLAHQNVAAWPQLQRAPQNDNQNYLSQLHVQLESCYYQFYSVEKERKKTEIELSRLNPGRRISSANTIQTPQLPDNPTSLDRMIVDFYKEHSRVYTLMSKIGGLCAEALHPSIDACLDNWVEAIQEAWLKRREELQRAQNGNTEHPEQRGNILVDVLQKLAKATRSIRTALWCALQLSKANRLSQNENSPSPLD
ncbi:uncharacterized protein LOC110987579 isoform X2 [Acanthaster planci]|uniref:Uncharacterized protein LOC110987579 isoform X2 n=1 Tax=Acanthaster planci TaxID=133434 RepID=A0A8B7ZM22_ACAPL|nr:uncharacterized protein LOC110987579 isoform X2 [Acanthaster planci]